MFDKDTLQALQEARAIETAAQALSHAMQADGAEAGVFALPSDFTVHDRESTLPNRRRARGLMSTIIVSAFAKYVEAHKEEGALIFVNPEKMNAMAVLNLGTPETPGHADNRAALDLKKLAAFVALGNVTGAHTKLSQTSAAEFFEDWRDRITCFAGDEAIPVVKAIATVRKLNIEALSKVGSEVGQLSAERTAFESVKATSAEAIPTTIKFRCVPYVGLAEREFVLRLGIFTGDKVPMLNLRIVNAELHAEQMAAELSTLISDALGDSMPVLLGDYRTAP